MLSDAITRDLHGREKDLLWKQVAYTFGSRVLDALINPLVNPQWVASPDDIPDFYQDLAIGVVKKKAAIAALCIPINDKTRTKLIRGFGKFVNSSAQPIVRMTSPTRSLRAWVLCSYFLLFLAGSKKVAKAQAGESPDYDRGASNLRRDELMGCGWLHAAR